MKRLIMRGVVIACLSISLNALAQKIGGDDLHPGNREGVLP